jgi:hypothetical protein
MSKIVTNERAIQARQATEIASAAERQSPENPHPKEPVARDGKATILPLKATILPLKGGSRPPADRRRAE